MSNKNEKKATKFSVMKKIVRRLAVPEAGDLKAGDGRTVPIATTQDPCDESCGSCGDKNCSSS